MYAVTGLVSFEGALLAKLISLDENNSLVTSLAGLLSQGSLAKGV